MRPKTDLEEQVMGKHALHSEESERNMAPETRDNIDGMMKLC